MVRNVVREVDTNGDGRIDQAGKITSTGKGMSWPRAIDPNCL
jgi:hypothetical protein